MDSKGHIRDNKSITTRNVQGISDELVLEKNVFSKVFDKDIRRVFIYKKAERIAKAIHLIMPGFKDSRALRDKLERLAVELVDASVMPLQEARERLSRGLLSLSSALEMGKSGGLLSEMNANIVSREIGHLLEEIAAYEEPRISLPVQSIKETRSIPQISSQKIGSSQEMSFKKASAPVRKSPSSRREEILDLLKGKGPVFIKDISQRFRDVSEKTIQRELQQLAEEGVVLKKGERRWTTYELRSAGSHEQAAIDPNPVLG